jgi:hypothetical protein
MPASPESTNAAIKDKHNTTKLTIMGVLVDDDEGEEPTTEVPSGDDFDARRAKHALGIVQTLTKDLSVDELLSVAGALRASIARTHTLVKPRPTPSTTKTEGLPLILDCWETSKR